jgi:hypothetical protein
MLGIGGLDEADAVTIGCLASRIGKLKSHIHQCACNNVNSPFLLLNPAFRLLREIYKCSIDAEATSRAWNPTKFESTPTSLAKHWFTYINSEQSKKQLFPKIVTAPTGCKKKPKSISGPLR